MGIEIEKKFLVKDQSFKEGATSKHYRQGYIATESGATIRLRIDDNTAYLTLKKRQRGITRLEFEYKIPIPDAEIILESMCGNIVDKRRYFVTYAGNLWEIDEFSGRNAGLVMAEIELISEDQQFEKPPWAGREVTDDRRYYNAQLAVNPYELWR